MRMLKIAGLLLLVLAVGAGGWIYAHIERRPGAAPLASHPQPGLRAGQDGAAAAWLAELYRDSQAPSISAAVGIGGQLVWSGAIGHADLASGVPATPETRYRIGSISKSITAIAALRLADRGVVDIDAPFSTYVPDFPSAGAGYSLKHLLSHQAGIRHYAGMAEYLGDKPYAATRDASGVFAADPLLFPPGTGFTYSSHGYTLVALALEQAVGRPFGVIVQEEVLAPAGLSRTGLDRKGDTGDGAATRYMLLGGQLFQATDDDLSGKQAGGGFLSTPADLVTLGNALLAGTMLRPQTRERMWTPLPLAAGTMNPERYGLGFRQGQDDWGRFVHHGGTANGGSAMMVIYPDLGLTVALCANVSAGEALFDRLAAARRLAGIFVPG